jgi:hypothetical protein
MRQYYYADFKSLRFAYEEVKSFIELQIDEKVTSLNTKIEQDLGLAGDDTWGFVKKFVTTYKIDDSNFDYSKHFSSEADLFDLSTPILLLISTIMTMLLWIIRLITIGKINHTDELMFTNIKSGTLDIKFGDMLVWRLIQKCYLRTDLIIRIKYLK